MWDFKDGEDSTRGAVGCDAVGVLSRHYTTSQPRRQRLPQLGS